MPKTLKGEGDPVHLRFGGGLHSRASDEDIDSRECVDGENFDLDSDNFQFSPRKPFDLVGTLPNAGSVLGAATLLKSDGTISTLIQGGNTVYEWTDSGSGADFTSKGSCTATAQLRGRLEHQWQISDEVLITDLSLQDPVKKWDGTTLSNVVFTDEGGHPFGTFRSRYLYVTGERAVFANIYDGGAATAYPHLMVGSKLSDYTQITVSNRPAGSLSAGDPFYLVQPDNFRINGIVESFGVVVLSSFLGNLYKLTGSDATDFALTLLASRAGVAGTEALAKTSNDVIYGKQGRIESTVATQNFGDVAANDLSRWIDKTEIAYGNWIVAYNARVDRTYCHPVGGSKIYVLHHDMLDKYQGQISPWSRWTTVHSMAFNPTLMMPILSPVDGMEYILLGDSSGNVYLAEGTADGGDGGTQPVTAYRKSGLVSATGQGHIHELQGWVRYRKKSDVTLTLKTEFSGDAQFTDTLTIDLDGSTAGAYYGTTSYYGTTEYYGTATQKLSREQFAVPGESNDCQVQLEVTDTADWTVNEVGFRYKETN